MRPNVRVREERADQERVVLRVRSGASAESGFSASRMSKTLLASRVTRAVALLVPCVNTVLLVAPPRPRAATCNPGPVTALRAKLIEASV